MKLANLTKILDNLNKCILMSEIQSHEPATECLKTLYFGRHSTIVRCVMIYIRNRSKLNSCKFKTLTVSRKEVLFRIASRRKSFTAIGCLSSGQNGRSGEWLNTPLIDLAFRLVFKDCIVLHNPLRA